MENPVTTVQVESWTIQQQIHVGLPVGLHCPHIHPVALEGIGINVSAIGQHFGDDVAAEIVGRIPVLSILSQPLEEDGGAKGIDCSGGQGAGRLLWLLLKTNNPLLLIHDQDTEARGLLGPDLNGGDGEVRLMLLVEAQQQLIVHTVDVVAGQDQEVVRIVVPYPIQVLIHCIGRILIPVRILASHVGLEQGHPPAHAIQVPGAAASDVIVERTGAILGEDPHGVDVGMDAIGEHEVNDPVLTSEGHRWLGPFVGQHTQSGALASGQDHRYRTHPSPPPGGHLVSWSGPETTRPPDQPTKEWLPSCHTTECGQEVFLHHYLPAHPLTQFIACL